MRNSKIVFTCFFSIFIQSTVCELVNNKDVVQETKPKDNIHLKRNIDRTIIVRPLPAPFTLPPLFKPQPPIVVALGLPNGIPNNSPNFGFNPYPMVVPLDFIKNLRPPFHRDHPSFGFPQRPDLPHGLDNFDMTHNTNIELNDGKNEHFVNLVNPNLGSSLQSYQYFGPQMDAESLSGDLINNKKPVNLGTQNFPPHIEIFRSLGYSLPSEITFNHPINYAKEYLLDAAATDSIKNIRQQSPLYNKNSDLLTGEEELFHNPDKEEILSEVESKKQESVNKMENLRTNFHNQYYYFNRKPITFDDNRNNNSKPKNIFEIISAQKISPKEFHMTEENLKELKIKTKEYSIDKNNKDNKKPAFDEGSTIDKNEENEPKSEEIKTDDENLLIRENRSLTLLGEDSGLSVLELEEKKDDKLLLLLPQENGANLRKSLKKRSTNDSFNVNIGAGYGVGIDQNTPFLPESKTHINSTNPLASILQNEHVIIGKYPDQIPKFHLKRGESKSVPALAEPKYNDVKKGVMDMTEIQQILHNVDDNSGYSKIVQVVKVPAVYEIHLEKFEKNHQHAPKQYIQQINNLANKPKKKYLVKVSNHDNRNLGSTLKDVVKIDDWQKSTRARKRTKNSNTNKRQNPIYEGSSQPTFREKKNTKFIQNPHPQNHQNSNRPDYTPYYPPTQQKHSVYTTLTRQVPYAVRRELTHRSEVLTNDLVYGTNKEKVLNPEEINITIEPGTTMVTVPKLGSNERDFKEDKEYVGCNKHYNQPEIAPPPELQSESSNIDNIYFTTLKPVDKEKEFRSRSDYYGHAPQAERRNGVRPIKYMLYINKIITDYW